VDLLSLGGRKSSGDGATDGANGGKEFSRGPENGPRKNSMIVAPVGDDGKAVAVSLASIPTARRYCQAVFVKSEMWRRRRWSARIQSFEIYVSALVIQEASAGDQDAAAAGLEPPVICTPDELLGE
jgi:hypothetical protein